MNWNKFFTGTPDHGDHGNEDETETEDEDITDSNGTVSTDKRSNFLGVHFQKFSHNDLSQRCIKSLFLTINVATLAIKIAGIIGIVTSIWTLTDNRVMSRLVSQRFFITTLLFIGLTASLVSLLGILGLLRRRRKFLSIYALFYMSFLCVTFISAIMSIWIFEEITKKIQDDMNTSIESYQSSFSSREAWDNTHRYLKCCGVKSAKDWAKYHVDIPKSCCSRSIEECLQMTEAVAFKSGCLRNAVLLLKSHLHTISMSAVLVFVIMLVSFLLALCILARMNRES